MHFLMNCPNICALLYYLKFISLSGIQHQLNVYTLQCNHHHKSSYHPSPVLPTSNQPPFTLVKTDLFVLSRLVFCLCFILFSLLPLLLLSDPRMTEIIWYLIFLCLIYFTQHNTLKVHPSHHKWQNFILFFFVIFICFIFRFHL